MSWRVVRCYRCGLRLWAHADPECYWVGAALLPQGGAPYGEARATVREALRRAAAQRVLARRWRLRPRAPWEVRRTADGWECRIYPWFARGPHPPLRARTLRGLRWLCAQYVRAQRDRDIYAHIARWPSGAPLGPQRMADGTLAGWRWWSIAPDGHLRSPHQDVPWLAPRCACRAAQWDDDAALRGRAGIHAVHPAGHGGPPRDAMIRWLRRDVPLLAVGLVAGWGRVVVGEDGWRAEHAAAQLIYVPRGCLRRVARRYPRVPVRALDALSRDLASGALRSEPVELSDAV